MQAVSNYLIADMTVLSFLAARMGDYERARQIQTGLDAVDPNNHHLLLAAAITDVMESKHDDALGKLNTVLDTHPNYSEARCWLGYCQVLVGDDATGRANLQDVLDDPEGDHNMANELLDQLDEQDKP